MAVLDQLFKEHNFSQSLYSKIKKNITANLTDDKRQVSLFVEDLPLDLKTPLSISIYEDLHSKIDLLKGKK